VKHNIYILLHSFSSTMRLLAGSVFYLFLLIHFQYILSIIRNKQHTYSPHDLYKSTESRVCPVAYLHCQWSSCDCSIKHIPLCVRIQRFVALINNAARDKHTGWQLHYYNIGLLLLEARGRVQHMLNTHTHVEQIELPAKLLDYFYGVIKATSIQ